MKQVEADKIEQQREEEEAPEALDRYNNATSSGPRAK